MSRERNWLSGLLADLEVVSEEVTTGAASGSAVVQSGRHTIVQSGGQGTYVNGRKVSDDAGSVTVIDGRVYLDGKRVDS
jgi:hypothetical protein